MRDEAERFEREKRDKMGQREYLCVQGTEGCVVKGNVPHSGVASDCQ